MNGMVLLRRSGALLLLAAMVALVHAAVAPLAAASCEREGGCPACPMMAKRGAPCHPPASSGMTAPIGCCENRAVTALAAPVVVLVAAPAFAALAGTETFAPVPESTTRWLANPQGLGLYTLHSVWRI